MTSEALDISGLFLLTPKRHEDARGFFMEVYRLDALKAAGVYDGVFVQENHSYSRKGILRGLHTQWDPPLGKLIRIIAGAAFVVAVDIRPDSTTCGKWFGAEFSAENQKQLFVPPGFASGFCVTGDVAEVEYQYTAYYNPNGEGCIRYDDPDIGIDWPIKHPIVSDRDAAGMSFQRWNEKRL